MPDPQQDLVYAMERLELGGQWQQRISLDIARRWVRQACKTLEIDRPTIVIKTLPRRGEYDADKCTIALDTQYGRSALVLLHGLAHHVTYIRHPRAADHGPTFMRIYALLLDMTRLVPFAGTKAACKRHGVKMARRG